MRKEHKYITCLRLGRIRFQDPGAKGAQPGRGRSGGQVHGYPGHLQQTKPQAIATVASWRSLWGPGSDPSCLMLLGSSGHCQMEATPFVLRLASFL